MSPSSRFVALLALGFVSLASGARAQLTTVFEMNFNSATPTWDLTSTITIKSDAHSGANPTSSFLDVAPMAGNTYSGSFAGDLGFWEVNGYGMGPNYGVQLWVKNAGSVGTATTNIFSVGYPNSNGISLSYGSGFYSGLVGGDATVASVAVGSGSINGWDHLALVTAEGTTTFYVNGISRGTSLQTVLNPGAEWHGFLSSGGASLYSGLVDEIKVFTFSSGTFSASQLDFASAIPEPSTYAMIAGLGALGLAAWRRRARRHALRMV